MKTTLSAVLSQQANKPSGSKSDDILHILSFIFDLFVKNVCFTQAIVNL